MDDMDSFSNRMAMKARMRSENLGMTSKLPETPLRSPLKETNRNKVSPLKKQVSFELKRNDFNDQVGDENDEPFSKESEPISNVATSTPIDKQRNDSDEENYRNHAAKRSPIRRVQEDSNGQLASTYAQSQGFKLSYEFEESKGAELHKPTETEDSSSEESEESSEEDPDEVFHPVNNMPTIPNVPDFDSPSPIKPVKLNLGNRTPVKNGGLASTDRTPSTSNRPDPAELSLSARVALFERNKGPKKEKKDVDPATIPLMQRVALFEKAAICEKKAASSKAAVKAPLKTSISVPAASSKKKVSPKNSLPQSPSKVKDSSPSPSPPKVGRHTAELHRRLQVQSDDSKWKESVINSKVQQERKTDMKVLLNRWEQKIQEEHQGTTSQAPVKGGMSWSGGDYLKAKAALGRKEDIYMEDDMSESEEEGEEEEAYEGLMDEDLVDDEGSSDESTNIGTFLEDALTDCANIPSEASFINSLKREKALTGSVSNSPTRKKQRANVTTSSSFVTSPKIYPELDQLSDHDEVFPLSPKKPPRLHELEDNHSPPRAHQPSTSVQIATSPPKTHRQLESEVMVDPALLHTVSFYRKQKQDRTPVQTIVRNPRMVVSPTSPRSNQERSLNQSDFETMIADKIMALKEDAQAQHTVMNQACSALDVCRNSSEFKGSAEQVEGERLLLIATEKRKACLEEIEKLKSEIAIGSRTVEDYPAQKGVLVLSDITLPLNKDFLAMTNHGKTGEFVHYFICVVKHRAQVVTSQMLCTMDSLSGGNFYFTNMIQLKDLTADFNVQIEVYGLQTRRDCVEKKSTLKKDKSKKNLTPLRKSSKSSSASLPARRMSSSSVLVRNTSFAVVGSIEIGRHNMSKQYYNMDKVPSMSPLEGSIHIKVKCGTDFKVTESGFLTMFEDVSGLGNWHRRWFTLNGNKISYWKYPGDETTKSPMAVLDLRRCITPSVKLAPRDICARPQTLLLLMVRPQGKDEVEDLVTQNYNNFSAIKVLLSADTKEDRLVWCKRINASLNNIRTWDPEALPAMGTDSENGDD